MIGKKNQIIYLIFMFIYANILFLRDSILPTKIMNSTFTAFYRKNYNKYNY